VNTHHDNFCEYHIISYELHYRPTLTQVGTYIVHMLFIENVPLYINSLDSQTGFNQSWLKIKVYFSASPDFVT